MRNYRARGVTKDGKPKLTDTPLRGSWLEDLFAWQLKAAGIHYQPEFKFHPKRRWRADFCIPTELGQQAILVEIEGAVYTRGRHTRGAGYEADCEKYSTAALMGYCVLRGTARHVKSGELLRWVEDGLTAKR